ncbi:NAD(P)-dependent oxidoreductase [Dongia sp.]|uniref:SDR family oxidoreductase n=1 Tax=Dongia sp. TaxID=1977262 RepID=UPI0035B176EF
MPNRKLILIAGRNAVLAQELDDMIWPAGYEARALTGLELGILNIDRLRRNLATLSPVLIINTIGYASADGAENQRVLTQARSHWSVGDLAEAAGSLGIPLLHLSSDQVFAGDKGAPYLETDRPDAVSVFGQALAAGEAEVGVHCANFAILRTGWLFGAKGHNMLKTMLSLGRRGGRVHVPNDHISGPTPVRDLCAALRRLGLALIEGEIAGGNILHFAGAPTATWFEFASHALRQATPFQAPPELIPITPNRFGVTGAPARRTELDCRTASRLLRLAAPDWRRALDDCVEEICLADQRTGDLAAQYLADQQPYRQVVSEDRRRGALPFGVTADRRVAGR